MCIGHHQPEAQGDFTTKQNARWISPAGASMAV